MERMERHRVARDAHPRKLRPVRLRLRARRGLSVRSHESSDTRFTPSFAADVIQCVIAASHGSTDRDRPLRPSLAPVAIRPSRYRTVCSCTPSCLAIARSRALAREAPRSSSLSSFRSRRSIAPPLWGAWGTCLKGGAQKIVSS